MRPLPRLCTSGTVPGASHGPRLNFARGYYRYGAVPASPMSQTALTRQKGKDLSVMLGSAPQDSPAHVRMCLGIPCGADTCPGPSAKATRPCGYACAWHSSARPGREGAALGVAAWGTQHPCECNTHSFGELPGNVLLGTSWRQQYP